MNDIFSEIEKVCDKESFIKFLYMLAFDYEQSPEEWENRTVNGFIESMAAWLEDYSVSDFNTIDWNELNYSTMAKVLYMGKIYE